MPYRTRRGAGLARVPLRLVILVMLGIAALAAAGCADDDGLSPWHPERGIAGTWVRYDPAPPSADISVAMPADTIQIAADRSVRWSREYRMPSGEPVRGVEPLVLDVALPFLFLNYLAVNCPACETSANTISAPHYQVLRDGDDRFELRAANVPIPRQFYRRADPAP